MDPHEKWIEDLKKKRGKIRTPGPKPVANPKDKNKK
jgi:hypothetical protein